MFNLIKKYDGIRTGLIKSRNKSVETPCFFVTCDFGGGGTNVSRLLVYSDMFIETNAQLLMNYYYLDIHSDVNPRFDTNLIKDLQEFSDIGEFIQHVKKTYLTSSPKKGIEGFKYDSKIAWIPITLLDSGSGNILRGKIKRRELTHENYREEYKKIIKDYLDFAISKKFDMVVAMDFAEKNTLKAKEKKDKDYVDGIFEFSSSEKNMALLKLTLSYIKKMESKIHILAPIHGNSPSEYKEYIQKILSIEQSEGVSFTGFAVGGLGNPNTINRNTWEIPSNVNGRVKAASYLMKIVSILRSVLEENKDYRSIHILGAAAPYNLIPLISAGCDTFDCHSAWRRASDGNKLSKDCVFDNEKLKKYLKAGKKVRFSKIIVPLLDSNLNILEDNSEKFLEFVKINEYNYKCNCGVCSNIKLNELKKLYCGNKEENYYAKILIYLHNVFQYDYICKRMRKLVDEEEKLKDFIESIPDCKFKKDMKDAIFNISS